MAEDKRPGTGQEQRHGKSGRRGKQIRKMKGERLKGGAPPASKKYKSGIKPRAGDSLTHPVFGSKEHKGDVKPRLDKERSLIGDEMLNHIVHDLRFPLAMAMSIPRQKVQFTFWHVYVETDEPRAKVEQEFTSAVQECITAVSEAHEQMQSNRGEIERLGEETRRLLSELKAA